MMKHTKKQRNERRRHKRLVIKVPIKWRLAKGTKQNVADALLFDTANITRRGLFLKTDLRPKVGSLIDLELTLNNCPRPIKLKGKVVWIAKLKSHPRLYPGVGIQFEKISQEDYKQLNAFLRYKFANFHDAMELKNLYLRLKNMASRLVELEERHASAVHFRNAIENAILEIDDVAHILDKEINEIKQL